MRLLLTLLPALALAQTPPAATPAATPATQSQAPATPPRAPGAPPRQAASRRSHYYPSQTGGAQTRHRNQAAGAPRTGPPRHRRREDHLRRSEEHTSELQSLTHI